MKSNTNVIANWEKIESECVRLYAFAQRYDPDNLNFWPLYIWKVSSLVHEWGNAFNDNDLSPQYERTLLEKMSKKSDEIIANVQGISHLSDEIKTHLPTYFRLLKEFKKLVEEELKKLK